MNQKFLLPALLLACLGADAQKVKKEDQALLVNLQQHISYLASDSLAGRRMGTRGEELAARYVAEQFSQLGLQAKGNAGFLQRFDIDEGKKITSSTFLHLNGEALTLGTGFFPLSANSTAVLKGEASLALQEPGAPWFFDLKEVLTENAANPHFDLEGNIRTSVKNAYKRGATAVFLYNSSTYKDGLAYNGKDRSEPYPVPVVYLQPATARKYLSDASATLGIEMLVDIGAQKRTGHNVVGYIDNGAPTTVILGAHLDHLGLGEDGNSREVAAKGQIHNGADDNASGTAALIELARALKGSKSKANNYLFIAFSGEELGLYGSKYFTANPAISLSSVNYMINMDMVGRLNDSAKTVTVGGYGTSPIWGQLYGETNKKKKLWSGDLQFRFDSSGTGPSDHTSFYLKDIPVLFYFTGLHTDYHKPTDDADKINYTGELTIVKHILSLIDAADKRGEKLAFTRTREQQTTTSARFTVSMGIMPDYTYSGAGVRVDGVSPGKAAEKAGLKAGDIITALGEIRIGSMEGYMQALGKFKKGEKTTVQFTRGGQTLSSPVEF